VMIACPGGQAPVPAGTDPTTCCPIEKCPVCSASATPVNCPMIPACACPVLGGVDPTTCCPSITCGSVDPTTGKCL